ncbi:hypothetical protein PG984_016551 [Apiospora sp. TS-2023a]
MGNHHIPNPLLFQDNPLGSFYNPGIASSSQSHEFNVPNPSLSAPHPYSTGQRNTLPYGIGSHAAANNQYANQSNSQAQQQNGGMRDILNPPPTGNIVPRSSRPKRGTPRSSRQRQPPPALWEKHKSTIQALYIDQKMRLQDVIVEMRSKHDFNATQKMYKDRFKDWNLSKKVPQKKVAWMHNKLNECKPQKMVFQYRDMELSEERIMKLSNSHKPSIESQEDENELSAATPSDVQYRTAMSIAGATPQPLHDLQPLDEAHNSRASKLTFNYDSVPEDFDLSFISIDFLRALLQSGSQAAKSGNHADAEKMIRDGLLGFRHLLTPTHDETLQAGYQLASFYADTGHMNDADTVLDWMTAKHIEKWGGGHEKTLTHHTRLIKLLHQWGRAERAEVILFKLMDDTNDLDDIRNGVVLAGSPRRDRSMLQQGDQQHGVHFFHPAQDPATVTHQLNLMEMTPSISDDGLTGFLTLLIEHWDARPDELGLQGIKAKSMLARTRNLRGDTEGSKSLLSAARSTASRLLCPGENLPSRALLKAATQLAFTFLEADNHHDCNAVLNEILYVLQARPIDSDREEDSDVLIGFLWSTAAEFNRVSDWSKVRPWIERSLGICIKTQRTWSKDAKEFRRILRQEQFQFRSEKSVHDIMDSSTGTFQSENPSADLLRGVVPDDASAAGFAQQEDHD